ncbi:MAG: cation:proton antiporter [Planctomycetales bacterium]|nr:cation:proton antiporter [Planctomycetales bacterium]
MSNFHELFLPLLVQLAAIIAAARIGAVVFRAIGQPEVVGEILAGLLLGPSCLGRLAPEWLTLAADVETRFALRVLSELGLVLLMFLVGLEFDFSHLRHVGRTAGAVAAAGIAVPFALGAALAVAIHPVVAADVPRTGFALFLATALSITAIPILGRIMIELGLQRTSIGTLTITAAVVDDVVGWVLLIVVASVVGGEFSWVALGTTAASILAFAALVFLIVRPVTLRILAAERPATTQAALLSPLEQPLSTAKSAVLLVLVLLAAAATSSLGVFAAFGPFVLGAALSTNRRVAEAVTAQWRPLVFAMLLPVFLPTPVCRRILGGWRAGCIGASPRPSLASPWQASWSVADWPPGCADVRRGIAPAWPS